MPVSHLGLTVSHIPSATSFYLAALQPLGYRFIGHQGNSIGLGVYSADFFLTQSPVGAQISPNHIAFLAESRVLVRECYAAALNSGGRPSGPPNYRNEDCTCFNAAVEDLDGNTVEFIFRQPHGDDGCCGEAAPRSEQRSIRGEEAIDDDVQDDVQSVSQIVRSQEMRQSRPKSTMQTALDVASTTSRSMEMEVPVRGLTRTKTEPAQSTFPSRTMVGTALGAVAGAALMYAMGRAERANAKAEANHLASINTRMRSRSETRKNSESSKMMPPPPPMRARSVARSAAPISHPAPPSVRDTRKFHRNFSTTESAFSTRRPAPQRTQAMKMLESTGHNVDDDVQEALGRYNSLRAMPTRSRTQDDYAYAATSRSGRSDYNGGRRSSTIPVENREPLQYLLDGPKSTVSRRSINRHDLPSRSASHSSHSHQANKGNDRLHRNDSGVSVHSPARSHHHHRERGSDTGRRPSSRTITPSRRDSAQYEPQSSRAASKAPSLLIESAAYYPAAISLPPSIASTRNPAALPPLHISEQSWEQFTAGEESDGLGDVKTVVPDDSISCVDLSKRRRRRTSQQVGESSESGRSHRSHRRYVASRHSERRSEASESTVRPVRREKEKEERGGKRSIFGF